MATLQQSVDTIYRGINDACKHGHKNIVLLLTNKKGIDVPNYALRCASTVGNIDIISALSILGADNWQDALWCVCESDNVHAFRYVFHRAKTRYANTNLSTYIQHSCGYGSLNIIKYILEQHMQPDMDWTGSLVRACANNQIHIIEFILNKKFRIYWHYSVLWSTLSDRPKLLQMILEKCYKYFHFLEVRDIKNLLDIGTPLALFRQNYNLLSENMQITINNYIDISDAREMILVGILDIQISPYEYC